MSSRNASPIVPVMIAISGQIAIVILLADVIPFVAIFLFLFCGFWVPAWFLWDRIIARSPGASEAGKPWILIPAFLPLWSALVVVIWSPVQNLTHAEALTVVLIAVISSTGLLLWRSPSLTTVDLRAMWNSHRKGIQWIALGVLLGGGFIALEVSAVNDLSFSAQPTGRNSSLYFLAGQESAFWDQLRMTLEEDGSILVGVGIANDEGVASDYVIVVTQGGEKAIAEINPISLQAGARWEGYLRLQKIPGGDRTFYFFLERVGFPWPYRQLILRW